MAVKGSGGDLRSITASGFAVLYLDKLEALIPRYRGEAHEDEMVAFYPLCAFGENRVAASIDTPLHAFLPFDHVDHLHPDWAIALAASANGARSWPSSTRALWPRRIVWVPWQRPGFELALMLRRAVEENPGCDGIILGGHGLFTWGARSRSATSTASAPSTRWASSSRSISGGRSGRCSAGRRSTEPSGGDREAAPRSCRICAASCRRTAASIASLGQLGRCADVRESTWAEELCRLGTSCPDHFLRTRISPDVRPVGSRRGVDELQAGSPRARALPRGLRRLLQGVRRRRIRRRCATRIRRSSSFPGSGCSGSRRTSARRASPPSSSSTPFT